MAIATGSLSAAVTVFLIAWTTQQLAGRVAATWLIGRAAGLTAYLVMVLLVLLGLALARPDRDRSAARLWFLRLGRVTQLRVHLGLAVFLALFTISHAVALALDEHAGVGWAGALLPMASTYRPVPVTLGLAAAQLAAIATLTALLAGRLLGRTWALIHKIAVLCWVLAWLHAVLAGSDTAALQWFYLLTGLAVAVAAARRYRADRPGERVPAPAGGATWLQDPR